MSKTGQVQGASSYWHGDKPPGSHSYISEPVVAACRRLTGARVIDLGCGNGWLCKSLAEAGYEVCGFDASENGIENARRLVPSGRFLVANLDADSCGFEGEQFDIAVSTEVIEHLYDPNKLLRYARSVLRERGYIVITTPYHGYLKNLAIAGLAKWDHHHQSRRVGGHIKFWSRLSLTALLSENGFLVERFEGVGRMPWLWKSMLLVARKTD